MNKKQPLALPGLFCRQGIYLKGWTVLICQTAPYRQNYRSLHLKRSTPLLNNAKNAFHI